MYEITDTTVGGAVGIICAHVASERGWTSDWQTVQPLKKRTPRKPRVIQTSTESIRYSSDDRDSAAVPTAHSDSGCDIKVPDNKKSTSSNNGFACLDYFLDWDEEPDEFFIHLAATAFIDKDDPFLANTEDDYWYDNPITNYIDVLEEIDRPLQQLEFRFDQKEEAEMEAMLHPLRGAPEPTHHVEDDTTSDWDPQDWDVAGPDTWDSISQFPEKYRHDASHLSPAEHINPIYRDLAGTALMSDLERKQRLRAWIMASECSGDWQFSSIESQPTSLFQSHVMKTEHRWETRGDEDWEYGEDEDDQAGWSWSPRSAFEDEEYERPWWGRTTVDKARRMGFTVD